MKPASRSLAARGAEDAAVREAASPGEPRMALAQAVRQGR
jgi:hypothetical protein